MNERIRELLDEALGSIDPMDQNANVFEKFAELIVRDVLAQVKEIQRLDNVLKTKVGIDFEIDVAQEVLKNYNMPSGFCACCGAPAGTPCDESCVWS